MSLPELSHSECFHGDNSELLSPVGTLVGLTAQTLTDCCLHIEFLIY